MAKGNNEKIRAQDIFDANVAVAYKDFVELNKQATDTINALKTAIRQLNIVLNKSKAAAGPMKKVATSAKSAQNAVIKTQKAATGLNAELTKTNVTLNKTSKNMNKVRSSSRGMSTSFKKIGASIRTLMGALGIAGLVFELVNFVKATYNTAKALESMELALSKVTDDTYQFVKAQRDLVAMSDRLGINLLKTAKRYNTFLAAARQAGFTQGENNEIFETFATVGANLALSSDEMGGIFLALEQMMSKGKISTEELRRQLGEKLPGAFGLMAEAVGVTTGELDDMLRKGLVPTAEYLPEFTRVVREYFNVNLEDRVDTLAAAQERLTNSFTLFVQAVAGPGSKVGEFFKDLLDDTTKFLNKITEITEVMDYIQRQELLKDQEALDFWDGLAVGSQKFLDNTKAIRTFIWDSTLAAVPFGEWFMSDSTTFEEGKAGLAEEKAFERRKLGLEKLQSLMKGFELEVIGIKDADGKGEYATQLMLAAQGYSPEHIERIIDSIDKAIQDVRNAEKKAQEEADKKAAKDKEDRAKKKEAADKKFAAKHKGHKHEKQFEIDNADFNITEKVTAAQNMTKLLQGELDKLLEKAAEFRNDIALYGASEETLKELAEIETNISNFQTRIANLSDGSSPIGLITEFQSTKYTDRIPAATRERIDRKAAREEANEGTIFGGLDDGDAWAARIELAQELASSIWEIEENLHQRRLDRLEEEKEESARKYQELYRLAEGDAEATKRLDLRKEEDARKFEDKERKLEKENAKRKKRQALIDIALNAAVASIQIWTKPGFPGAIPLQVVIAATALAATAAVLSAPEYAEGTDFHEGGLAIVGDGGRKEAIISPDGSVHITDDKPQLVNMERGSKVVADAQEFINKQVIRSIIDTNDRMDELIVEKITEAVQKGFKGVNINNNVTLRGSADFHAYKHNLLN